MDQISDLKQWLDSQKVKSDQSLSPHHDSEGDFQHLSPESNKPFVPSPKFKQETYYWNEDGKDEHPEMNIVAGQLSDYEKAKALWYKNAWESVQPVDTEADDSNIFKKSNMRKIAVARTCPECNSADHLWVTNRTDLYEHAVVENESDIDYVDSEYGDSEFIKVECNNWNAGCGWFTTNLDWWTELNYDNRKNSRKIIGSVDRACPNCNKIDNLWLYERAYGSRPVAVQGDSTSWEGDSNWSGFEELGVVCHECNWSYEGSDWIGALGYNNQKNSNIFKTAVARTCPQCNRSDSLVEVNKVDVSGYVSVDNQDVEWYDSEYGDNYEFVAAECSACGWETYSPNWVDELGYDNRKNDA